MQERTQVTCSLCGRSFDAQEELDLHNREEHGITQDESQILGE